MLQVKASLFFILAVASQAQATFLAENPDCVLFADVALQGDYWTATARNKDPFLGVLRPDWLKKTSSIWVRNGYVLEAYPESLFNGQRIDMSKTSPLAKDYDAGFSIDLTDLDFNDQLASYRCRPALTQAKITDDTVPLIPDILYTWRSSGNHPSHKSLEFKIQNGEYIALLHADDTYGSNREDYTINLNRGSVRVDYLYYGQNKANIEFELPIAMTDLNFALVVRTMIEHVDALAKGYNYFDQIYGPPAPELSQFAKHLKKFATAGE